MKLSRNLPNQLTISRIIMIMIFVALANIDASKINFVEISPAVSYWCHVVAYVIAILAGITDFLDGKIARAYHFESDFGRLMDPLADKIFVASAFIMLSDYRIIPAWIVVVILAREFLITGLRQEALSDGVVIAAGNSGKIKTVLQMGALLIAGGGWIRIGGFNIFHPVIWKIWYCIMLLMTFVTLYSGISYCVKNYKLIRNKLQS